MNPDYSAMFPHASKSFLAANADKFMTKDDPVWQAIQSDSTIRAAKQPNKTEQEFGQILNSRIQRGELMGPLMFEGIKLRIAGNCYFTPDWMCCTIDGMPAIYEVKGAHIWDDAKVKFKAAQEMHKWAKLSMWQKKEGQWNRIL